MHMHRPKKLEHIAVHKALKTLQRDPTFKQARTAQLRRPPSLSQSCSCSINRGFAAVLYMMHRPMHAYNMPICPGIHQGMHTCTCMCIWICPLQDIVEFAMDYLKHKQGE